MVSLLNTKNDFRVLSKKKYFKYITLEISLLGSIACYYGNPFVNRHDLQDVLKIDCKCIFHEDSHFSF